MRADKRHVLCIARVVREARESGKSMKVAEGRGQYRRRKRRALRCAIMARIYCHLLLARQVEEEELQQSRAAYARRTGEQQIRRDV